MQSIAKTQGGRLLCVLFIRIDGLSTDSRAARLLSVIQTYFRQIISGRNDNRATVSESTTILLRECGPNSAMPAADKASAAAPTKNAGPDM